jgi:hypothetical protein
MNAALNQVIAGADLPSGAPVVRGAGGAWQRELEAARRLAWFPGPRDPATADPADNRLRRPPPPVRAPGSHEVGPSQAEAPAEAAAVTPAQAPAESAAVTPAQANPLQATRIALSHGAAVTGSSRPSLPAPAVRGRAAGGPFAPAPYVMGEPAHGAAPFIAFQPGFNAFGPGPAATSLAPHAKATAVGHPSSAAPRSPVRVHLEVTPQGVLVWLGLDARQDQQAVRAATLAVELRRALAACGQRVAAVVCNGAVLDAPHPSHRQEP